MQGRDDICRLKKMKIMKMEIGILNIFRGTQRRMIEMTNNESKMMEGERVFVDCKHGRWLSPCPICADEKKIAGQGSIKFTREHFIRIDSDKDHYYYSFGVPGFEICLEPCAEGFDVAVYTDDRNDGMLGSKNIAASDKRCTRTGDYVKSAADLFGERSDKDWNKALEIADELLDKYMNDREKLAAILAKCQNEKMKCMVCGCTYDHACPGGCAWIAPNLCSKCADRVKGNHLISGDEIIALRTRAKTITIQEGLRITMTGGFVPVIPMEIKSGYVVNLTKIESPPRRNPIEVLSIGSQGRPDPADSEIIALAVLGKGYVPLQNIFSKRMVHFARVSDL